MPFPVLISLIAFFQPQPFFDVQKIAKNNTPKGKILLDIIKSCISKTVFNPRAGTEMPLHILKPKQQGNPNITNETKAIMEHLILVQFFNSIKKAIIFSKTAITVDSAAKLKNIKNNEPNTEPKGICAKTLGRV